jgi:hypothetical protein
MRTKGINLQAALLGVFLAPLSPAGAASLTGHWEGSIVLVAAEQEVDVVADFKPAGGKEEGQVRFPLTADGAHPVEDLRVHPPHVSFAVHDASGVDSTFDGVLSPDGATLQGTMKESGTPMSFTLRRTKAAEPRGEPPIAHLGDNAGELARAFNGDVGKVRMILLLDPTSFVSRVALRIVERYVLDRIADPNVSVYAVWMTSNRPAAARELRYLAGLAPDPRVTHFWATDPSVAKLFEPTLALYQSINKPCMLYAADRSWEKAPPLPDGIRKTPDIAAKEQLDPAQRLNGNALAADVKRLLARKQAAAAKSSR